MERSLQRIPFDSKNKPQNDLVHEFSMQIHHGQFFISANGFFNINLDLLGSVGA